MTRIKQKSLQIPPSNTSLALVPDVNEINRNSQATNMRVTFTHVNLECQHERKCSPGVPRAASQELVICNHRVTFSWAPVDHVSFSSALDGAQPGESSALLKQQDFNQRGSLRRERERERGDREAYEIWPGDEAEAIFPFVKCFATTTLQCQFDCRGNMKFAVIHVLQAKEEDER